MIRERYTGTDVTVFDEAFTGGLGKLKFYHPAGTFTPTPASEILLKAIAESKDILRGTGIDWGSGIGCQAILAGRIKTVDAVYGLDISPDNTTCATANAIENGVDQKVRFILSDSYCPFSEEDKEKMQALRGRVGFVLSNPPSSDWDDGFGFRRIVLAGAKTYLRKGGVVLLNISRQYGQGRIRSLLENPGGFRHVGVAASSACVPFDLSRPELMDCLTLYVKEEEGGGMNYEFIKDMSDDNGFVCAREALDIFKRSGASPLTKWQAHLFQYEEEP